MKLTGLKYVQAGNAMSDIDAEDEQHNRLLTVLSHAVSHVSNEAIILAQFEAIQDEPFPHLWARNDDGQFSMRMDRVAEHLGGPLDIYVVRDGHQAPPADNYPPAALQEATDVFARARKSVLRALMFSAGFQVLSENPDLTDMSDEPAVAQALVSQAQSAFWEHAEAAYIRLYSFWDRVGQVLDFAFFNIRKFDQNGFNSVMDRIHVNAVPMDARLKASGSWKRLRTFQCSEKEDGLKWLLQRRNLVVHSLHLHPVEAVQEDVFKSQFNHLDVAHREKLRPRTPRDEMDLLAGQLNRAAELFSDFLAIIELTPSRKPERFVD
ncbi:hypothetical protein [Sphingopyxis sp.]|uniref:hypothetical protein n=1 Tax=Sphingopyxis sp. TaxID=1908224 RepID=UPI002B45E101|nr:hypothetical protein [Sphingopyxis sp.]HJS09994.1 hypothetical protein [Sphingopyxis sp.]